MDEVAGEVDVLAQGRIPHDVEIGEGRNPESLPDSLAPGLFGIEDKLRPSLELDSRVQREHPGQCGLRNIALKAVRARIRRVKLPVSLEDEICLTGDPETIRDEVVHPDCRVQLVVGLILFPLIDVRKGPERNQGAVTRMRIVLALSFDRRGNPRGLRQQLGGGCRRRE